MSHGSSSATLKECIELLFKLQIFRRETMGCRLYMHHNKQARFEKTENVLVDRNVMLFLKPVGFHEEGDGKALLLACV